ncbi:hypothetical protein BN000_02216 [Mycobacterium europaeum]|uniref:Uncharacterized protein n=1 Tax=Mycobacterium europaeum TaxID=761804 RepID=A0A0U1DAV0_9MYCO|nr:hypothetical protein [Mycobacterium europaeum]CQD10721.1 hypothetical protein BN000_02216 [Mycobacterium europaeum]
MASPSPAPPPVRAASTLSALNGVESPAYSIIAPVISWSWAALATPMAIFVPIVIDASLLVLP